METPRVVLTWPEKDVKVPKTPKKKRKSTKKDPPSEEEEVCRLSRFEIFAKTRQWLLNTYKDRLKDFHSLWKLFHALNRQDVSNFEAAAFDHKSTQ